MTGEPEKRESFALRNDPPRKPPAKFVTQSGRQQVLFSGLSCEPGQADLFPTDGKERDDTHDSRP